MSLIRTLRAPLAAALIAVASLAATLPSPVLAQAASEPTAQAPAAAPAPAPAAAPTIDKETVENPYGLSAMWKQGDWVAKGTLIIMVIRSMEPAFQNASPASLALRIILDCS